MVATMEAAANEQLIPRVLTDLGARALEVSEDVAIVEMPVSPKVLLVSNYVFGGALIALADVTAGLLTLHTPDVADGVAMTTTMPQISISCIRNTQAGMLRAEARYIRRGRRLSVVETRVTDDDGRLLVLATSQHVPAA